MTQGLIASWKADHLRVTLFSDKAWDIAAERIFSGVFGFEPEEVTQKPASGEATAVGKWASARMTVKRLINRIDFVLQPIPGPDPEIPLLSDIGTTLPQLALLLAESELLKTQEVVRIAIGCGGYFPVADTDEAYRVLRDLVRVIVIDAKRFRELQFQVNLSIQSTVSPELLLNRITNWGSVKVEALAIGPGGLQPPQGVHFATCVVEVNTDAARTSPIQRDIVSQLLDEVSRETIEILDRGIE